MKSLLLKLSASNVSNDEVLPNLLKQARRRINAISGDDVYDTKQYYETARIKRAILLIQPPKKHFLKTSSSASFNDPLPVVIRFKLTLKNEV
ncbi:hypothetical protein [Candidatus Enterovibrio altilux]|uniref:Transposase n=1 Tax=Candidatus Enterovibrio altilux TaxID=1927128 RepID=A0A291BAI6_9GAMM|nr:Transposase [Candidatus Enterovibrio luxaltus]